ncbi:hypothetical protein AAMO2058_000857800 [Amorphochlora amoebiformis]
MDEESRLILDFLPSDSNGETPGELLSRFRRLVRDTRSVLYSGKLGRYLDPRYFETIDYVPVDDSQASSSKDTPPHVEHTGSISELSSNPLIAFDEKAGSLLHLPCAEEIEILERVEVPKNVLEIDELLTNFPRTGNSVWIVSKMFRSAKKHKGRNVGVRSLTLEHRKRVDMQSSDPNLIRQHAVDSFLNLLSPSWRVRLIYGQLTQELREARSYKSALRNASYGTELALSAAATSMEHLTKCLSHFLVSFTESMTPEGPDSSRHLEVNSCHVEDKKALEKNRKDLIFWVDNMVTAIEKSGKGSVDFQLVVNAIFAAVSDKFTPATTPKSPDVTRKNSDVSPEPSPRKGEGWEIEGQGKGGGNQKDKRGKTKNIFKESNEGVGVKEVSNEVLRLVGGFVFLRLLNPKLLQPSGLLLQPDQERTYKPQLVLEALESSSMQKNLKLLCKVIMMLSNGKRYASDNHLAFLNPWLNKAQSKMDKYLEQYCTDPLENSERLHFRKGSEMAERQYLADLRKYLILLLPKEEIKIDTKELSSENLMPGPERRKHKIPFEQSRQHDGRFAKTLTTFMSVVVGLEKIHFNLSQTTMLGADTKAFEEKVSVASHEIGKHALPEFTLTAYAPRVFIKLQRVFGVLSEQILHSLSVNLPYSDVVQTKKGSAFMYTHDKKFVLKTKSEQEFDYFFSVLDPYYQHMRMNRNSLLARVLGMYEITQNQTNKVTYLVLMANVCYGQQMLHCRYDLKATNHRSSTETEKRQTTRVLKDNDFTEDDGLMLAHAGGKVIQQLKNDIKFLTDHEMQGYRLMVGVYMERTLESQKKMLAHHGHYGLMSNQKAWSLDDSYFDRSALLRQQRDYIKKMSKRLLQEFMKASHLKIHNMRCSTLSDSTIFHGISSTPVERKGSMRRRVVYIGIIDIMREYDTKRKIENFWRGLREGGHHSAIPPKAYGERMIQFVSKHLKW